MSAFREPAEGFSCRVLTHFGSRERGAAGEHFCEPAEGFSCRVLTHFGSHQRGAVGERFFKTAEGLYEALIKPSPDAQSTRRPTLPLMEGIRAPAKGAAGERLSRAG